MRQRHLNKTIHFLSLLFFIFGVAGVHLTHPYLHHQDHSTVGKTSSHANPSKETAALKPAKKCTICGLLVSYQLSTDSHTTVAVFDPISSNVFKRLPSGLLRETKSSFNPRAPPA